MSPTQRTLKFYRGIGFTACVVEKWIPQTRRRLDAFGFGDLLCCEPDFGIILAQACAGASHAARRTKILSEPRAAQWLAANGRIDVVSWSKRGARGKRKVWTCRREEITAEMLLTVAEAA